MTKSNTSSPVRLVHFKRILPSALLLGMLCMGTAYGQVTISGSGGNGAAVGTACGTNNANNEIGDTGVVCGSTGNISMSGTLTAAAVNATDATVAGTLSAGTVTAASVTATSVNAGTVTAASVTATSVNAGTVTAASVTATSVNAGTVTAASVTATSVNAGTVTAASVTATSVNAGTVTAASVTATNVNAQNATTANALVTNSFNAASGATINMGGNVVQNVGDAVNPMDAVNKRTLDKAVNRTGAIAAAHAMIQNNNTTGEAGEHTLGAGMGTQGGHGAFAIGYSYSVPSQKDPTQSNVTVRAGIGASGSTRSGGVGVSIRWK